MTPTLSFPAIDQAIANFEGFGTPGTLAQRNNNPGNLMYGSFATSHGASGAVASPGGILAVFPDATTGAAAEDALVSQYANQGYTIQGLINAWAPGTAPGNTPQSTQNYVNNVASIVGVPASTPLSQVAGVSPTTGQINLPGVTQGSSPSLLSSILSGITGPSLTPGLPSLTGALGFSWGRVGAFLIGIVAIIGALYLFKPTQEIIAAPVRAGTRAAREAAIATAAA